MFGFKSKDEKKAVQRASETVKFTKQTIGKMAGVDIHKLPDNVSDAIQRETLVICRGSDNDYDYCGIYMSCLPFALLGMDYKKEADRVLNALAKFISDNQHVMSSAAYDHCADLLSQCKNK